LQVTRAAAPGPLPLGLAVPRESSGADSAGAVSEGPQAPGPPAILQPSPTFVGAVMHSPSKEKVRLRAAVPQRATPPGGAGGVAGLETQQEPRDNALGVHGAAGPDSPIEAPRYLSWMFRFAAALVVLAVLAALLPAGMRRRCQCTRALSLCLSCSCTWGPSGIVRSEHASMPRCRSPLGEQWQGGQVCPCHVPAQGFERGKRARPAEVHASKQGGGVRARRERDDDGGSGQGGQSSGARGRKLHACPCARPQGARAHEKARFPGPAVPSARQATEDVSSEPDTAVGRRYLCRLASSWQS